MANEYLEMVRSELSAVGISPEVEHGGKHIIIRWKHADEARRHVIPCSPSDRRGLANSRADVRRILRDDGLIGDENPVVRVDAAQVFPRDGVVWCSSIEIAQRFEKAHKDVLRSIDRAAEDLGPEFTQRNFAPSSYVDGSGRSLRAFDLTRDGFSIVAMGFTGNRAMAWKRQYLEAFNAMEREITAGANALAGRIQFLEGEVSALSELLLEAPKPVRQRRPVVLPSMARLRRQERRLSRSA